MNAPVMTSFDPLQHGFSFVNQFANDFIPQLDWRTFGLCGGMSYAALDYYNAQMLVPTQQFRPANGTTLHSYLYERQVNSIVDNYDKWAEVGANPLGIRDDEFFSWGISIENGGRIDELRQFLDKGTPCVLGLQSGNASNHQVIAIGYTLGRYQGNPSVFLEEFNILVCDPNYPNLTRTLIADTSNKVYRYKEGGTESWRTYFVDRKYQPHQPPAIPNAIYPRDNLAYELVLQFSTGADDLRGGSDNLNLVVNLTDGTQQTYPNINLGSRWLVNNDESAEVILQKPVPITTLHNLVISATFGGGSFGDNWSMNQLIVFALGGGFFRMIAKVGAKYFTGEDKTLIVPLYDVPTMQGQANKLVFTFQTGDDDLRGVNDNVNATIRFSDGRSQRVENLNGGQHWTNYATHTVSVDLNHAVAPKDIVRIDLETTFAGGTDGDNWNMNSVAVQATGVGVNMTLATSGFKRFTGDDRFLAIPVVVATPTQANRLQLTIRTGGDDLRGGNDNLNVTVGYRDGRTQFIPKVNGGAQWANNTTRIVNINLDHAVSPADIISLKLQTTFSGGFGGDNWNMDSVQVTALGTSVNQVIFASGFKRFTASDGTLVMSQVIKSNTGGL